jgi:hypothetical protein
VYRFAYREPQDRAKGDVAEDVEMEFRYRYRKHATSKGTKVITDIRVYWTMFDVKSLF